ncbi:YeiH family protein [Novipirellula caenicola]|uniref:Sulfate exporter family transporter n=1 Tax=Novipirellula caenicola TaxID=1536901 RepID=A0ABP9VXX4_9BACT
MNDPTRDENSFAAKPDDVNASVCELTYVDPPWYRREDWVAVIVGLSLLGLAVLSIAVTVPDAESTSSSLVHPWADWMGTPGSWESNPLDALTGMVVPLIGSLLACWIAFTVAAAMTGRKIVSFAIAFPFVFALAMIAYLMEGQTTVKHLNLSSALWAIVIGLVVSNTVGVPGWMRPAVATELYIKTGLVVLGGEILFDRLLALGVPGIFVAWVVTPIVLCTTFWFGQRVLKMESKTLNMVISADMSVCGVSAAIAASASCKAKKEELSLAISMSLLFTVVMMIVMPFAVQWIGLDPIVGGAWIGGTIDSTGAVTAAGKALGEDAEKIAVTVKMIQNILIGVASLGISIYWVACVQPQSEGKPAGIAEVWRRFPRFVIGFLVASVAFTLLNAYLSHGEEIINATTKQATKGLRNWFFCLAFVSIGLDTRFADLLPQIKGGKPMILYLCGQSLNLVLTLAMAYLMFGVLFRDTIEAMLAK